MLKVINQIRWICLLVLLADLFFKTGLGSLAFLVWVFTSIHTYSIIERKFFEEIEKQKQEEAQKEDK